MPDELKRTGLVCPSCHQAGDIRAAQAMLRQRQLSTTVRYTLAGVPKRVELAVDALDKAFGAGSSRMSRPTRLGRAKRP